MEIFLVLSNLAMLSSMFAGADSLFEIVVPNFPYRLAGVLSAFVCILVVCFGFRGLTKTNAFVVPLLILMIVLVFVFEAKSGTSFQIEATNPKQFSNSILFSLLFLGSNMFFAGFVFSRIGKEYEKKEIVLGSLIGSILLFLALVFLLMLLFLNPTSFASNMPVVDIALSQNLMLGIFSLCVIWLGLLTTSFAMLYTISNWLKTYFGSPILMTTLASLVALVFSGIGFNLFIQVVYPILGFFGFVFMFFVFLAKKRTKKSKQKKHPKGAFVDYPQEF